MTGPIERASCLGEAAIRAGYRMELWDEVASTNDVALERAAAGDAGRLWIVARHQAKGRGRHGRVWTSMPGNLYATLALVDACEAAAAPEFGFLAGLALHDAAVAATGASHPRLALKWPNDLVIDGAKCAGILLEDITFPGAVLSCSSVLVSMSPRRRGAPYAVTSLASAAPGTALGDLFARLSDSFASRYEERTSRVPRAVTLFDEWAARAHGIGAQVKVRLPSGEVSGLFRGIDRGRLVLSTAAGEIRVEAGDVFVMPPPPEALGGRVPS